MILTYSSDVVLRGELLLPPDPTPPAVVVVHGGAGLDDHARRQAARIAALGHPVLAADMYGEGVAGDRCRVMAAIGALRADPDLLVGRAQAALDLLTAHVDSPSAVVGYCFGGLVALELARAGLPIAGAVSIHGSLATTRRARPGGVSARILVSHGAADPHIPWEQVTAFVDEMTAAGADVELQVHGGAQHGFTHAPDDPPQPGVAHHALADARTFARLTRFLHELRDDLPDDFPRGRRLTGQTPLGGARDEYRDRHHADVP